jgi:quercetin dioxygenase-like cupin family protein
MVRRKNEFETVVKYNMKGGEGAAGVMRIFQPGEYGSDLHMIGKVSLAPGASLGYHRHDGEEELVYVLSGVCDYNDDGVSTMLYPGDACLCLAGHSHSIHNPSETEPLVCFSVIAAVPNT